MAIIDYGVIIKKNNEFIEPEKCHYNFLINGIEFYKHYIVCNNMYFIECKDYKKRGRFIQPYRIKNNISKPKIKYYSNYERRKMKWGRF